MTTQIDPRLGFNHPTSTILNWSREPLTHHVSAASRAKTWPVGPGRPMLLEDDYIQIAVPIVVPRDALTQERRPHSVVDDWPHNYANQQPFPLDCPYLVKLHCRKRGSSMDGEAISGRAEPNPGASTSFNNATPRALSEDESIADTSQSLGAEILVGITPVLASWPIGTERSGTPGSASVISLASHVSQSHSVGGSSSPTTLRRVDSSSLESWAFLETAPHSGSPAYQVPIGTPNHTSMSAFPRSRDDPNRRVAPFGTATIIHTGSIKQLVPDSSGLLKRGRSLSGTEKDATNPQQAEHGPRGKRTKLVHEQPNEIRAMTDHTAHPPSKLRNELHLAPLTSHYI